MTVLSLKSLSQSLQKFLEGAEPYLKDPLLLTEKPLQSPLMQNMEREMENGRRLKLPEFTRAGEKVFGLSVQVAGPDDSNWPPVTQEQVNNIKIAINQDIADKWAKEFGQKEIRITDQL